MFIYCQTYIAKIQYPEPRRPFGPPLGYPSPLPPLPALDPRPPPRVAPPAP